MARQYSNIKSNEKNIEQGTICPNALYFIYNHIKIFSKRDKLSNSNHFPKKHFSNKKQCDKKREKIIILKKT